MFRQRPKSNVKLAAAGSAVLVSGVRHCDDAFGIVAQIWMEFIRQAVEGNNSARTWWFTCLEKLAGDNPMHRDTTVKVVPNELDETVHGFWCLIDEELYFDYGMLPLVQIDERVVPQSFGNRRRRRCKRRRGRWCWRCGRC